MIKCALESQKKAYTPYSNFNVGASVLTDSGKIYGGCNIENASYTPTVCAERVAIFKDYKNSSCWERKFFNISLWSL